MTGIANVGFFLVGIFFSLVTFILWLRIAFRFFRVNALSPIVQMTNNLTNPIINPIMRTFGLQKLSTGRYDWTSFIVLAIVVLCKYIVINFLFFNGAAPIVALFLFVIAELIVQPCDLLFYAIILLVIISWVNPGWRHPAAEILYSVTSPLLNRCRQLLPDTAGIDFAPLLAIILLKVITIFVNSLLPFRLQF